VAAPIRIIPTSWLPRGSGRRELFLFAVAYLTYFGVRAATEGSTAAAVRNALRVFDVERALDVDWEYAAQRAVLGSHALLDAANAVYIWGHWPLLIVGGALLFELRRGQYYRLRNVCLLSGAIGLVVFALFPVAPPRLAPVGLVDTVTAHAPTYRTVLPTTLVNEYAAMPSFHAGWNLLIGIELFRASSRLLMRAFAVVMPVTMALAVVATANHYVLDVAAGALIVTLSLLAVTRLQRRRVEPSRLVADVTNRAVRGCAPGRQRPRRPAARRARSVGARRG
jgi:membrane-associated phospholipid phosphatase